MIPNVLPTLGIKLDLHSEGVKFVLFCSPNLVNIYYLLLSNLFISATHEVYIIFLA